MSQIEIKFINDINSSGNSTAIFFNRENKAK